MNISLVGHPGSQFLVPASKYLTEKYLPGFNIRYINHTGPTREWSRFVYDHIKMLSGPLVIFSLDDYLIGSPLDRDAYDNAINLFMEDGVRCVKLFPCTDEEHEEYPVTTQYTIWDRRFLLRLLLQTSDPWDFEMRGSKIFKISKSRSERMQWPALHYNTSSALSKRWSGVRIDGLGPEDSMNVQTLINQHAEQR